MLLLCTCLLLVKTLLANENKIVFVFDVYCPFRSLLLAFGLAILFLCAVAVSHTELVGAVCDCERWRQIKKKSANVYVLKIRESLCQG